jgi:hypothetical protein
MENGETDFRTASPVEVFGLPSEQKRWHAEGSMVDSWQEYQEDAARFFRSLGLEAVTNLKVQASAQLTTSMST